MPLDNLQNPWTITFSDTHVITDGSEVMYEWEEVRGRGKTTGATKGDSRWKPVAFGAIATSLLLSSILLFWQPTKGESSQSLPAHEQTPSASSISSSPRPVCGTQADATKVANRFPVVDFGGVRTATVTVDCPGGNVVWLFKWTLVAGEWNLFSKTQQDSQPSSMAVNENQVD